MASSAPPPPGYLPGRACLGAYLVHLLVSSSGVTFLRAPRGLGERLRVHLVVCGAGRCRPGDPRALAVMGACARGSRRDRPAPGRCRPARRCVIPAASVAGMGPPPLAAMLAAATKSRWPPCPQCGQRNTRPAGLGTRREQDGHVEDVPRSSVTLTVIPAASALSRSTDIRCLIRQSRSRLPCTRPAASRRTPRGSPAISVPARCFTAQSTTDLAASCWAWRTRRAWRAPAACWRRRCCRHRRDPRCPGFGARRAAARVRALLSRRLGLP